MDIKGHWKPVDAEIDASFCTSVDVGSTRAYDLWTTRNAPFVGIDEEESGKDTVHYLNYRSFTSSSPGLKLVYLSGASPSPLQWRHMSSMAPEITGIKAPLPGPVWGE